MLIDSVTQENITVLKLFVQPQNMAIKTCGKKRKN